MCGQKLSFDGRKQWSWNRQEYALTGQFASCPWDFNALAIDSTALLCWAHYDSSARDSIYVQCIEGDGTPRWDPPLLLSGDPSPHDRGLDLRISGLQMQPHTKTSAWVLWSDAKDSLRCRSVGIDSSMGPETAIDTIAEYEDLKTISDGRGGFYVVIENRHQYRDSLYSTLRLHRVDSSGALSWGNPVSVASAPAFFLFSDIVRMRDSTVLVAWWECLAGHTLYSQEARLCVQRVSPAGALIGGGNPVVLIDSAYYPGSLQLVAARDSGGQSSACGRPGQRRVRML